ncbi:MAG: TolC family protein [Muribaculaceae bacterium]|nr:TolC family protein [Muribaculaceae bacterium]
MKLRHQYHIGRFLVAILCLGEVSLCAEAATTSGAIDSISATTPESLTKKSLTLSRQECLAIALQSNPTIRIADMEIQRVDYSKKEVLAGVFPSIDFTGAYQRAIELQTIRMNMGGESQSLKMGSDNTWNFGFNASMPIIAPTLWKSIHISDTQILANLEAARSSRLELINQLDHAYYALLLAIASRDVLRQNYDVAKLTAEIYEKQFAAGTATEYDVLRSSVQVKNIEPELLQADIAVKQCSLQLKVLMGIDSEVDIMPNVTLKEMQQDMYGYSAALCSDLSGNSSLRTLEIQKKMLKQTVDLKKFAWIPTLGASFNISWLSLSNGNPFRNQQFNPYSTVGLSLSIPIFSGGSKYYGLRQAQIQLKEIDFRKEHLLNTLQMQVDLALDNIQKEVRQISTNEEGVHQAHKAHEIMQKSFEIGAASYLDLRDAELADTSAQLAYYQAIYNYLISVADLDMLLGREDSLNSIRN